MKLFFLLTLVSFNLFAQVELLKTADQKNYNPRIRGITDLVVDVESKKLEEKVNEMKNFGHVKKLVLRFYWTAQPERMAIEIIGLPEGFKEIKEELKQGVAKLFEDVIPVSLEKRFSSFELSKKSAKSIIAKDKNNAAPIPSYELIFDSNDLLQQVVAHRPVGEMVVNYVYERTAFSDGKWVNKAQETIIKEAGQQVSIRKEINFQTVAGMGFPGIVQITTRHSSPKGNQETTEEYVFSNYSINKGDAVKYFLSEGK